VGGQAFVVPNRTRDDNTSASAPGSSASASASASASGSPAAVAFEVGGGGSSSSGRDPLSTLTFAGRDQYAPASNAPTAIFEAVRTKRWSAMYRVGESPPLARRAGH
jgi:hypothetical protein